MTNKQASLNQENNVAKALGGRRTPNSGATSFVKGDVIIGNVIVECKTKTKEVNSFAIYESWIKEINEEKIGMGKALAALAISFNTGNKNYYVIDENAMKILVEKVNGEV